MPETFDFDSISFPADASVLDGIEISVGKTGTLALFGPNGGGKSSILRVIAGTSPGYTPLADVAYLPQTPYMFRGSALSNLVLGLAPDNAGVARAIANDLDVAPVLDRPGNELSVGEAQRVCLARTLASPAPLVLLDEPLAPINASGRASTLSIIVQHTKNRALIVATHSIDTVKALADVLVVIDRGVSVRSGIVEEVLSDPGSARVAEILGDV